MQAANYGFPDAIAAFEQRHPLFTQKMANIEHAINMAFVRTQDIQSVADKFLYFHGALIPEDFMEIFLVAVNGYGAAAMKLVRTMYEQTVTLKYLHDHPNEVQDFLDYNSVQLYKLMKPIEETFGEGVLSSEVKDEQKKKFDAVKKRFTVKSCKSKSCDEMRLNHTWSKLDFVSMAKKAGAIGTLIVPGYYLPLRHAHPTLGALSERIDIIGDRMEFKSEHQPDMADQALMTAHNCLLVALEVQEERFKVEGLKAAIETCVRDWRDIWSPGSIIPGENNHLGGQG
jgi:hypothetical protein